MTYISKHVFWFFSNLQLFTKTLRIIQLKMALNRASLHKMRAKLLVKLSTKDLTARNNSMHKSQKPTNDFHSQMFTITFTRRISY